MRQRCSIGLLCFAVTSCGPTLTRTMIENHPKLSLEAMKPRVVESSAPMAPAWTVRLERGASGFIPFSGQAYGSSLEDARADAERDLLVSVASYVAVDVESELETIEKERTAGGVTSSSIEATQRTKTNTQAALRGVRTDELFWEKVLVSPLVPDRFMYRVYVHARVSRAEITKARLQRQLARRRATKRRLLVVLPFRAVLKSPAAGALQQAFIEELSRRLQTAKGLYVGDPDLVRGLVPDASVPEAEALQTIRDALAPDYIVGGSYQVHEGRIRVTYTVYEGDQPRRSASVSRPIPALFELEDVLTAEIAAAVEVVAKKPGAKVDPYAPDARDAYYAAYEAYRGGQNERALRLLTRAIELEPDEPRFYFRLGRVLERIGQYGRTRLRLPNRTEVRPIRLCTPWHLITPEEPSRFMAAAAFRAPVGPRLDRGAFIDDVASALDFAVHGGPMPTVEVDPVIHTAAGAYWKAFVSARARRDVDLELDVRIALGDLFIRTDRLVAAEAAYQALLAEVRDDDPNRRSLIRLGLGRTFRQRGLLKQARASLLEARRWRRLMMERPYLLEVENELGQVEVEAGRYVSARAHYASALRVADELDDTYFRAVLGNNLGVLELILGRAERAEAYFGAAWRALSNLDEAEGRVSTNLNIAHLGVRNGDLDSARTCLRTVREILDTTGQRGRRAELLLQEARLDRTQGKVIEALRRLLIGQASFEGAGRRLAALRAETSVIAAEFDVLSEASQRRRLGCLDDKARRVAAQLARAGGADYAYALLNVAVIGGLR